MLWGRPCHRLKEEAVNVVTKVARLCGMKYTIVRPTGFFKVSHSSAGPVAHWTVSVYLQQGHDHNCVHAGHGGVVHADSEDREIPPHLQWIGQSEPYQRRGSCSSHLQMHINAARLEHIGGCWRWAYMLHWVLRWCPQTPFKSALTASKRDCLSCVNALMCVFNSPTHPTHSRGKVCTSLLAYPEWCYSYLILLQDLTSSA